MKVLIVCSGNLGRINPFIADQAASLNRAGIITDFFPVKGKGVAGYLKNLPGLIRKIKEGKYDLLHAHYGLSGMLAVLQRIKPVIITFHGTDVNSKKNLFISLLASRLSAYNVVVIEDFIDKLSLKKRYAVIPCGVDLDVFHIVNKQEARDIMKLEAGGKIILFSSRFDNKVKNFSLAKAAADRVRENIPGIQLLELKGYSREQINLLMNAADALLVTSFTESGPLVVKEAMACNLPVVSTNVGDVPSMLNGTDGAYITTYDPSDVAIKLNKVITSGKRLDARHKVSEFENKIVASKLKKVYESVVAGK